MLSCVNAYFGLLIFVHFCVGIRMLEGPLNECRCANPSLRKRFFFQNGWSALKCSQNRISFNSATFIRNDNRLYSLYILFLFFLSFRKGHSFPLEEGGQGKKPWQFILCLLTKILIGKWRTFFLGETSFPYKIILVWCKEKKLKTTCRNVEKYSHERKS